MLLAAVRAGDVFLRGVVAAPQRHGHRSRDGHGHRHHTLTSLLLENADTLVFVGSCWAVMWCWFYEPRALPRSYNNWISRMSELHPSLHRGLRYIREGKLHYGKESPHNHLLFEVADGYGMPRHMGDIASFGPSNPHGFQQIPCLLVHKGLTDSCPGHWKNVWTNGFKRSILIYLPIHVIARIVSIGTRPKGSPRVNLLEVARRTAEDVVLSTSFLSTFITLVWMPICTLRSHVFRPGFADTVGYGPGLGSFLSGFSILLERKSRRRELALFVLPRALYALGYMLLGSARIATGGKRDPKHGRQIMRAGERLLVDAVAWPLAVAILVSCLRYGESRFYGRSSWVKLLVTFVAGRNRRGALGKGEQDGHNGSHTQSVAPK
ncbi:hypothetical protein DFJ74DRAFT_606771 [Hyaloraphidium curvatum]|nr:hypothetical protein DFJ74DRAFT_606771 [Hyaloraphidium curvatum]